MDPHDAIPAPVTSLPSSRQSTTVLSVVPEHGLKDISAQIAAWTAQQHLDTGGRASTCSSIVDKRVHVR
ncbi:MAG: hypothetical protein NVSMB10_09560 [Steroidobacteraceae bacterium]